MPGRWRGFALQRQIERLDESPGNLSDCLLRRQRMRASPVKTGPCDQLLGRAAFCPAIGAALLPFTGMTDHPTGKVAIHVRMAPAPVVLVKGLHQLFALCAGASRCILPVRQQFGCRAVPAFVIGDFFLMHQCLDVGGNGAGQRGLVFDAGWRLRIVGLAGTLGLKLVDASRYFGWIRLGVRRSKTSSHQQTGGK